MKSKANAWLHGTESYWTHFTEKKMYLYQINDLYKNAVLSR